MERLGSRAVRVIWSGVRSQTHVVYAASWLRQLLATTTGPITLVDLGVGGFLGKNPVTPADLERLLPRDDRMRRIRATGKRDLVALDHEQRIYLATGAPGIKPWLRTLAAQPSTPIRVVVTDEGIGSYGSWQTRRDAWRREGGSEPWTSVRAVAVATANQVLTSERWSLYRQRSGRWTVVEPVAAEFRRHRIPGRSSTAVFLSQPWVELGVLTDAQFRAHVGQVAEQVTAAGWDFAVRPHPAEDETRFAGFEVLPGFTPAELDLRVTSARAVLGATSTALLNLKAIFGIPAIRLTTPELARLDSGLGRHQRSLLDSYLPPAVEARDLPDALHAL